MGVSHKYSSIQHKELAKLNDPIAVQEEQLRKLKKLRNRLRRKLRELQANLQKMESMRNQNP
jgi:uncharacterized coiled-coil protein SlyX